MSKQDKFTFLTAISVVKVDLEWARAQFHLVSPLITYSNCSWRQTESKTTTLHRADRLPKFENSTMAYGTTAN